MRGRAFLSIVVIALLLIVFMGYSGMFMHGDPVR